jgi:hypothetical protein
LAPGPTPFSSPSFTITVLSFFIDDEDNDDEEDEENTEPDRCVCASNSLAIFLVPHIQKKQLTMLIIIHQTITIVVKTIFWKKKLPPQ